MILAVTDPASAPTVDARHPTLREDQPARQERRSASIGGWLVHYTGSQPTLAEVNAYLAADAAKGDRAAQAVDAMNRLQFEVLFNYENRIRAFEIVADLRKTPLTTLQFRESLIALWKSLNL